MNTEAELTDDQLTIEAMCGLYYLQFPHRMPRPIGRKYWNTPSQPRGSV